jgi:hypothetical protein
MLGGMYLFYKTYKNIFDASMFEKSLSKVEPIVIKRRGDADISTNGDLRYAKVLLDYYNKHLRTNRLDYRFKG